MTKETRIIEAVKNDNKATIDKIGEMLVAFKSSGQDIGSPKHEELIGRLDRMGEHIKENHNILMREVGETKEQVKLTNGRVRLLEIWQGTISGAGKSIWVLLTILGFAVFQVLLKFIN